MKNLVILIFIFSIQFSFGQKSMFELNDKIIMYDGKSVLNYDLFLKKDNIYLINVYQENIDVELILTDSTNQKIISTDLADANKGFDKLEFSPKQDGNYKLTIKSVSPDSSKWNNQNKFETIK